MNADHHDPGLGPLWVHFHRFTKGIQGNIHLVLLRLGSGLPTHLGSPSFEGQGAFSTQR